MDTPPAKKSLGQHWLYDQASLEAMCQAADVKSGNSVLEIGPGDGSLTELLVRHEAKVLALEFDSGLIPLLRQKFGNLPSSSFSVEEGDIRTFDFNNMLPSYKIVANIPYYLTANLMRRLTEAETHKPAIAALLMQKEVAERIAAQPGQMAFMSVAVQYYYEVNLGREVPAELFSPPPKVNSQILVLKLRPEPLFPGTDTKVFFQLVKAGFSQRRKTLLNSLSAGLNLKRETVLEMANKAGIDPMRRAQTLSLQEWHALYGSRKSE